ncbi:hypothetical protein KO361_05370 [Candidatus Woesearchaeota archaeon]|jgi:hypothetical protein|nr:hypothetical protein [Candidatus Woesearchaeota archaeon]
MKFKIKEEWELVKKGLISFHILFHILMIGLSIQFWFSKNLIMIIFVPFCMLLYHGIIAKEKWVWD